MRVRTALRSLAFAVLAALWTLALAVVYLPLLALPRRRTQDGARAWAKGVLALVALCCGLRHRVVGREHLPAGAAVIAAKHQSAWETLIFHLLLPDPVYVLKKELFRVPLFGWYLRKAGNIGIPRQAGLRAIRAMLPAAARRLGEGAQVVVFPEGTRVAPGGRAPYQPGIAALYARLAVPVVPVALNAGLFWGRRSFLKHPGVITLEFLPPIPPGLAREPFLATLAERIESASARLAAEAAVTAAGTGAAPLTISPAAPRNP
jgi:1-acyl-sn-glycerol-3-phosphate acyltransferase